MVSTGCVPASVGANVMVYVLSSACKCMGACSRVILPLDICRALMGGEATILNLIVALWRWFLEASFGIISVHAGNVFDADIFGTCGFTLVFVRAVSKAFFVHLENHVFGA